MAGVVILREDDEGARIVRPAAEDMEIERAPQRGRARRRLHPRKRVSVTHTPPAFHVGLHPWGQIQRKVTPRPQCVVAEARRQHPAVAVTPRCLSAVFRPPLGPAHGDGNGLRCSQVYTEIGLGITQHDAELRTATGRRIRAPRSASPVGRHGVARTFPERVQKRYIKASVRTVDPGHSCGRRKARPVSAKSASTHASGRAHSTVMVLGITMPNPRRGCAVPA